MGAYHAPEESDMVHHVAATYTQGFRTQLHLMDEPSSGRSGLLAPDSRMLGPAGIDVLRLAGRNAVSPGPWCTILRSDVFATPKPCPHRKRVAKEPRGEVCID